LVGCALPWRITTRRPPANSIAAAIAAILIEGIGFRVDFALAHALARIGLGINIAIHGLARIGVISAFAEETVKTFAHTFLPSSLVRATAYGIPLVESMIGLLLIAGLFLRPMLILGLLLMFLLIFGMGLLQQWQIVGLQLFYVGFYALLLATAGWDYYSVDFWRKKQQTKGFNPV
jgi:thiosulfate dehydrogenase [quinone] large subunit